MKKQIKALIGLTLATAFAITTAHGPRFSRGHCSPIGLSRLGGV